LSHESFHERFEVFFANVAFAEHAFYRGADLGADLVPVRRGLAHFEVFLDHLDDVVNQVA
jgi:hypothetical protein